MPSHWTILICTAVIFFISCVLSMIFKIREKEIIVKFRKKNASDQSVALHALARELANEIIFRDEKYYAQKFQDLYSLVRELKTRSFIIKSETLKKISKEISKFDEFDIIKSRPHVLYSESLCDYSIDELWNAYASIRIFHAIAGDVYGLWEYSGGAFTEDELRHVIEYQEKIKNSKLLWHLNIAHKIYTEKQDFNIKSGKSTILYDFEDMNYCWKHLYHPAETRVGVYIRDLVDCLIQRIP